VHFPSYAIFKEPYEASSPRKGGE